MVKFVFSYKNEYIFSILVFYMRYYFLLHFRMLYMHNEEVFRLIQQMKQGKNLSAWEQFIENFGQNIYLFPERAFNCSEDNGEFYVYVVDALDKGAQLSTYDPQKALFTTWFNIVLKNFYFEMKKKEERETIGVTSSLNDRILDSGSEKIDFIVSPDYIKLELDEIVQKVSSVLSLIKNPALSLILKLNFLYHFPLSFFTKEDLSIVTDKYNLDLSIFLKNATELQFKLHKKYLKKEEQNKLPSYFRKKIKSEKKLQALKRDFEVYPKSPVFKDDKRSFNILQTKIRDLEHLIKFYDKQIKRNTERFEKGWFVVRTGKKEIAKLLKIKAPTVGVYLSRAEDEFIRLWRQNYE